MICWRLELQWYIVIMIPLPQKKKKKCCILTILMFEIKVFWLVHIIT